MPASPSVVGTLRFDPIGVQNFCQVATYAQLVAGGFVMSMSSCLSHKCLVARSQLGGVADLVLPQFSLSHTGWVG